MQTTTMIPKRGSDAFYDAVARLKNAPVNCTNIFEMAQDCCAKCNKSINCEECYVNTVGDLKDPYRNKIQKKTVTGMYSSDMYKGDDGKIYYAHPQGSG